jgi:hypothetical protein
MLARTEIVNAHAVGQLNAFRMLGLEELGVMAEWSTGGDDRVCPDCGALEGEIFTVDEAEGMIPLHPNSFSKDTEIYTEDGWVNVSKLKKNDRCLSLNPTDFDLEYVPIVGTVQHHQKKMIHFKSHNFDLLVTPEHEMFAKRRERLHTKKRDWEFIQAKNIINETAFYRSSEWIGIDDDAIHIAKQCFLTDVFCEFMGWWLSEGSLGRRRIAISQDRKVNPDKYDRILEIATKVHSVSSSGNKVWAGTERIYLENDKLYNYLRHFGKSHQKHIPNAIKKLSSKYLRIFLDAYAAGDGYVRKGRPRMGGNFRNEIVYTTSSKTMADDIGELLIKVGRRPSYSLMKSKGETLEFSNGSYTMNHNIWIVRECYAQTSRVNPKTGIKKKEVLYNDMVYCVELKKFHTLLCRRNGKVTWAGNCRCAWIPSEQTI